jgi:hypothetical protein
MAVAYNTYLREFFEEIVAEVRQALAVRAAYLAALTTTAGRPSGQVRGISLIEKVSITSPGFRSW